MNSSLLGYTVVCDTLIFYILFIIGSKYGGGKNLHSILYYHYSLLKYIQEFTGMNSSLLYTVVCDASFFS